MDTKGEKKLVASLKSASSKAESLFHDAELYLLEVGDISKWIEGVTKWLDETKEEIKKLPDTLEQKTLMLRYLEIARKFHKDNDAVQTRVFISKIEKNWDTAIHDKAIPAIINMESGRRNAGITRKEQLQEQGIKTTEEVLRLYQKSNLPERNRATWIAKKLNITGTRVRQILKKEKQK